MYANSNIKYGMSIETSDYRIFAEDQASLTFGHMARTDGTTYTERLRIDSGGDVKLVTANDTAGTSKFLTFGTMNYNRAGIKCTNAATYDGSLEFYTGNASTFAERIRILPTGGITFNGDTAQANALSDYEEGIHYTTVSFSNSGSATVISNTLAYTKIGNAVIVTGYVAFNGISSPNGILRFTLPFPVAAGAHHRSSADLKFNTLNTGYGINDTPWSIVEDNASTVAVYGGQSTSVNFVMGAACTATTDFRVSVCYITSA